MVLFRFCVGVVPATKRASPKCARICALSTWHLFTGFKEMRTHQVRTMFHVLLPTIKRVLVIKKGRTRGANVSTVFCVTCVVVCNDNVELNNLLSNTR